MLFTGEYEHTIDAKQRLAIPAEIRSRMDPEEFGTAFYLSPGPNGALWLWPERTFEQLAQAVEPTLLPDEDLLDYEQYLYTQSPRVEMDKTGRVRLPERVLEEAGLGQHVIVLGVKDHLELRDPEQWKHTRQQQRERASEIMLRARRALAQQRID